MKRYQITYGKGHKELWGEYTKLSDALEWFEILSNCYPSYPFSMLLDRGNKKESKP